MDCINMAKKEKSNPEVSIIMSVYNEEKTLLRCINSVLNQRFKDFEFIIIDDYSNDISLDIIKD